jgi:hypothetical protein
MEGRPWRWHVAAAAAGLIVAVAGGEFFIHTGVLQGLRNPRPLGALQGQPATSPLPPSPSSACRMPVTTLSYEKGNTLGGGFVTLPDGTYQTDPASSRSFDSRLQRWLPVDPELVAPDGGSYADFDKTGVYVVDVASGSRKLLLPRSAGLWAPRKFTPQGIYVDQFGSGVVAPGSGLSLLTLDGRLTPINDAYRNWRVGGPGVAWGYDDSQNGDHSVYRLDLTEHSVTVWFHPPPGTTRMYVFGLDAGGWPFIAFRGNPSSPWHMGVVAGRDTFTEAIQPPEMPAAIGYGVGYTDSRGLWMGIDGVGLVLYAPDGTM